MPELPEVETIVRQLQRKVRGRTFLGVWTDWPKQIKRPGSFKEFKKKLKGRKIKKIWRRGKNIIFDLTGQNKLLIHQKMTGHLLYGDWQRRKGKWEPLFPGPLQDPMNRFLHLVFFLDNGQKLALSDLRKFAKVELWEDSVPNIESLGPEPLTKSFSLSKFKNIMASERGRIKQVLMDQTVIAGIGNIYSDEILWRAKVSPFKKTSELSSQELRKIYQEIKKVLTLAISLQGESISDYRTLSGEKGSFDKARKVYRKEGEKCPRCGAVIKRLKLGSRSAHFCPTCQTL